MGTFERWRRAFGAIKDSTTVSLAKVSSDFKNIDIAIVKATNHDESPPKDIHVKRIIAATSFAVPRADVGYCIHTLSKRLMKTKNWIVAVKTLMVLHRILREGDPSFREELLVYSRRQHIFQIPEFRDESSQLAWDCSSWIRTYAMFLEERLECYRVLGFDIETERLTSTPGIGKAYSRTRVMNIDELLDQLPAMQQLLHRLLGCQLEGAACHSGLIQQALAIVLKESFKIHSTINDGITRLVELFFDLPRDDAVNALNIYKKALKQVERLEDFYNIGKNLHCPANLQFPILSQPPPSFLATMEDYVRGFSMECLVSYKNQPEHQAVMEDESPREIKEVENKEVVQDEEHSSKPLVKVEEEVLPLIVIDDEDCQDLNDTSTKAQELNNGYTAGSPLTVPTTGAPSFGWNGDGKTSSWELAIVTLPSNPNNATTISQGKPGSGLDKLYLYSLYEDELSKRQKQNEFGLQLALHHNHPQPPPPQQDHFFVSDDEAAPTTATIKIQQQMQQLHTMKQAYQQQQCHNQYQQWYQHQQNMMITYNHQQSSNAQYLRQMSNPKPNPYGDGIKYPQ